MQDTGHRLIWTSRSAPGWGRLDLGPAGRYALGILALAAAYLLAARLGLMLARVNEVVTPLWPPSGLAIAALILWGWRMWPAVLMGACASDLISGIQPSVAITTGAANTAESLVAVALFLRVFKGRPEFERLADAWAFILAVASGCALSASFGTAAYALGKVAAPGTYGEVWLTWWLGDFVGALLLAPLALVFYRRRPLAGVDVTPGRLAGVGLASLAVAWLAFQGPLAFEHYPLAHLAILVVALAAFWFGLVGALLIVDLLSVVTIIATIGHVGPFGNFPGNTGLVLSQIFVSVLAISGLTFAALRAEGQEALHRLQLQHRELANLDALKEHLLSSLSHEIKTPLSLIKGNAELLEDRYPAEPEIRGILDGADRLSTHVDQIITYGALMSGTAKPYLSDVAFDELLDFATSAFKSRCKDGEIRLEVDVDRTLPVVKGDTRFLGQLVGVLLDNACKYSPRGGVVRASAGRSGGTVYLSVADQGPGISAEDLDRIWRPFERIEMGASAGYGGIGLGLAIAREIAHLHGGEIEVESAPGAGTRFTFRMPASPRPRESSLF